MKKTLYFCIILLFISCSNNFSDPSLGHVYSSRSMAIIPFDVITRLKKIPKGTTLEILKEDDRRNGIVMQRDAYRYLLRGLVNSKTRLNIQDVNYTNAILEKNGIEYKDLKKMSRKTLAEIIGVDFIMSGDVNQKKKIKKMENEFGCMDGEVSQVAAILSLHNRKDGKLLWHFEYEMKGAQVNEETNSLARSVLRNAVKNFPFFHQRNGS